jgi:conjugal transfer/entry exclusion protein
MKRRALVCAVVVLGVLVSPSGLAQNVNTATETTQIMNFVQLLQLAFTAENQLMTAKTQVEQMRYNMERLSRGDINALRDAFYQAMMVQNMALGYLSAQEAVAQRLQYAYPSPSTLDSRFQTWDQYHAHVAQVERDNYRTYTESARVIDQQLTQGGPEDGKLLSKLREKAGKAQTEQQQLQVVNQMLAEVIRQLQMLRMESLAAFRMQVLAEAAESQRRVAQDTANGQLLKPERVQSPSQYRAYTVGGAPR